MLCDILHCSVDLLDVRLVHEDSYEATVGLSEGRLEVSYRDNWIPVCFYGGGMRDQDYWFNNQAAWVACRYLGFYGGRRKRYQGVSVMNELTVNDIRCRNGKLCYSM